MSDKNQELENKLVSQNYGVIIGAVKGIGVSQDNQDYDDYIQVASIEFLRLLREWLQQPIIEFEVFKGRSYRKLTWVLKDYRLKMLRENQDNLSLSQFSGDFFEDPTVLNPESLLEKQQQSKAFLNSLSANERRYLLDQYAEYTYVRRLSERYGYSEKTLYDWRQRIQKKYQENY